MIGSFSRTWASDCGDASATEIAVAKTQQICKHWVQLRNFARSRLIRRRGTVAIKPEARRQIYWTMVSMDTLVSIGATNASSLERICRHMRHADSDFGEPIRKSNCALAWSGASS